MGEEAIHDARCRTVSCHCELGPCCHGGQGIASRKLASADSEVIAGAEKTRHTNGRLGAWQGDGRSDPLMHHVESSFHLIAAVTPLSCLELSPISSLPRWISRLRPSRPVAPVNGPVRTCSIVSPQAKRCRLLPLQDAATIEKLPTF